VVEKWQPREAGEGMERKGGVARSRTRSRRQQNDHSVTLVSELLPSTPNQQRKHSQSVFERIYAGGMHTPGRTEHELRLCWCVSEKTAPLDSCD
jgi:hypothetical protein